MYRPRFVNTPTTNFDTLSNVAGGIILLRKELLHYETDCRQLREWWEASEARTSCQIKSFSKNFCRYYYRASRAFSC